MSVAGIDPGLSGAIAVYEGGRILKLWDIPTFEKPVGGKLRKSVDVPALHHIIGCVKQLGVRLAVIEEVHGMPNNGAVQAFKFGWVCGVIYGGFSGFRIPVEMARPNVWKKALKVPADGKASVARADELFPDQRHLWRGPKGAALHDRAEAAMLARYGADTWCK